MANAAEPGAAELRQRTVRALDAQLARLPRLADPLHDPEFKSRWLDEILWTLAAEGTRRRGLSLRDLASSRLASRVGRSSMSTAEGNRRPTAQLETEAEAAAQRVSAAIIGDGPLPVEGLGWVLETLMSLEVGQRRGSPAFVQHPGRKSSGSYYTPSSIAHTVVQRALAARQPCTVPLERLRVCDPAVGAGAFLLEVGRQLLGAVAGADERPHDRRVVEARARIVREQLCGCDRDPRALAIAELALWWFASSDKLVPAAMAGQLVLGDALTGPSFDAASRLTDDGPNARLPSAEEAVDWPARFPEIAARGGFDLVLGNPPWVAFAGRAAQPLSPHRRGYFKRRFSAWRGYPTLHGLFVERSAALAPHGVVALLLPSPVADLNGYRAVRATFARSHCAIEPLLEFGQDAFAQVTQPCFALVGRAKRGAHESARHVANQPHELRPGGPSGSVAPDTEGAPWSLEERSRAGATAVRPASLPILEAMGQGAPLPAELFREVGFQSSRIASSSLFYRGEAPQGDFTLPLLEGRNVQEFSISAPRLFLDADPAQLARAGCRMRDPAAYLQVAWVIRQTAAYPIAALHSGLPFRNSLLGGFEQEEYSAPLLVGLLNSVLYRALHVSRRRDARQQVFPQLKIAHLRASPRPPHAPDRFAHIEALVREASGASSLNDPAGIALLSALDAAVFELFGINTAQQLEVKRYLYALQPKLARRG